MSKLFYILFLVLFTQSITAQTKQIDSLFELYVRAEIDTVKVNLLNQLAHKLHSIEPKRALKYALDAQKIAEKTQFKNGKTKALTNIGLVYYYTGDYAASLKVFIQAEKLAKEQNNLLYLSDIYNDVAMVYIDLNKIKDAEDNFNRCIEIDKKTGNKKGLADTYNNLASIYSIRNDFESAKEALERSLKYSKELKQIEKMAVTLSNLGKVNIFLKNYATATHQINQALLLYDQLHDIVGKVTVYNEIGDLKFSLGSYSDAISYYQKSLKISDLNRLNRFRLYSYQKLAEAYEKISNFQMSNGYFKRYIALKEKLFNKENAKVLAEIETKYKTDLKQREIQKNALEISKKNKTIEIISIVLLIIGFSIFYFVYSIRQKKTTNAIILEQKREVEQQNKVIEEINKDIRSSIHYAKRIQQAILPPETVWNSYLPDSFVINRPKDVLSGDFHWVAERDGYLFVAVADCTGHGVPGAFISIVCYNLLNKAVLERGITSPAQILNQVNVWLTESLHQTFQDSTVQDGMDICLIRIDKIQNQITYSGAFSPLVLIRNGELKEYKANKFPIGLFIEDELKQFKEEEIDFVPNDLIYLFSDGYADQFGGMNNKKLKKKGFYNELKQVSDLSINDQKLVLLNFFEEWKSNQLQTDDMLVVGLQLL